MDKIQACIEKNGSVAESREFCNSSGSNMREELFFVVGYRLLGFPGSPTRSARVELIRSNLQCRGKKGGGGGSSVNVMC